MEIILLEIQDSVSRYQNHLLEYKNEFESALKDNQKELKQLLNRLKLAEERLKKIDKVQKILKKNVEVKKIHVVVNEFEKNKNELIGDVKVNNTALCTEFKKNMCEQTSENKNKQSFAETLKKNLPPPDFRKKLPILAKPKGEQNVEKTKEDLP